MSEANEWKKEEVHVEEVVLTSSTDREPDVHAALNSLSYQDFGLKELAFTDEQMMSTSRSITGKWIKGRTAADARKLPESMVSSFRPSLAIVQQARLGMSHLLNAVCYRTML